VETNHRRALLAALALGLLLAMLGVGRVQAESGAERAWSGRAQVAAAGPAVTASGRFEY
jgi:hypothetical protein